MSWVILHFFKSKLMEVPKFNVIRDAKKNNINCLIIPVINEGEKFHSLLKNIYSEKITEQCDLIISDGGSEDNTIEISGPMNIIQLKDKEGLSAQLRAAYFQAKEKGYKNIITIDGNGKDDPVYIRDIFKKLSEGYDFVQCSRFLKEGKGVNTPKLREIAIRFIHAPVLSTFSGFKWTDTTQGYRGYSSRFLFDERISIFRNIFKKYELLAYLSNIAPRKNFKCIEVPVIRRYPKGKIPTKINSLSGNSDVLLTLLRACFGGFNAKNEDKF